MKTRDIGVENFSITEVISDGILIYDAQDALNLLGETNFSHLVLRAYNFEPDFFDLSTKKLGEVLQKFANYQVKIAIIGEFNEYPSKVLQNFIHESNKTGDVLFLPTVDMVLQRWIEHA